ncbi:MAG: DegV family protein [Oscillospiraceae bacterium]|nr:DegV family protein [Oscillospiraceae bacterium]
MAVKFIIDSASDVLPGECKKLDVIHVPLTVRFGDKEFADAVDLSHKKFYKMLTSGMEAHPTTSQVTPAAWSEVMEQVVENGDTAVVITISSKLSGTYQSACIAAEEFEGKIFVVDSMTATIGERLLLQYGIRLAAEGLDAAAIAAKLDAVKDKVRIYARLDTLEYLRKGGRISSATAVVGTMLNIKPIIAVRDGLVENVAKARGPKAADKQLRELVAKSGGIDFSKPLCAAWSGLEDDNLKTFLADSSDMLCGTEVPVATVGCVIGAHVGPGAVAFSYFEN